MARCLPGLRERAVFGFCRPDRDAVPPPGRRSAAIAPFIPRWRAAYRGYESVRSLDFAGRTGTQPPPPGRRPATIAPFIPRWRAAYRGYGSVRSLDFVARTGAQPRLREDGLRQSHRLSPGGALLTGATGACGLWILSPGQGRSPASGKGRAARKPVLNGFYESDSDRAAPRFLAPAAHAP